MRDHTNINVSESVSMADSNKSPKTMHADVNRDSSTLTWKEGGTVRHYPHHCRMPDIRIFNKKNATVCSLFIAEKSADLRRVEGN